MEAQVRNNQLESGITNALEELHFEDGNPTNSEEVVAKAVEGMVAYFTDLKGLGDSSWAIIDKAFSSIKGSFPDENSYMAFISQVSAKLAEQKNLLEGSAVYTEQNPDQEDVNDELNEDAESYDDEEGNEDPRWEIYHAIDLSIDCLRSIIQEMELTPVKILEKEADAIDPKMPLAQRYQLAQSLNLGIAWIASSGKLSVHKRYSDDESGKPLTPEGVYGLSRYDDINFNFTNGGYSMGSLGYVVEVIKAIEAEKKLMEALGNVDHAEVNKDRLLFGAKGANLLAVTKLLPKFKGTQFGQLAANISIPPFSLVGIDIYKKWKNKEDVTENLRATYEMYKGKPMMVRSSAVYSEDGEKMTGAGVYLSVPLEEDATFKQFFEAAQKVYESCDSEIAKKYRADNGVEEELMGLVVQERIENPDLRYINSTRPYSDDTVDMKGENQRAPFIFDTPEFDKLTFLDQDGIDVFRCASRVQAEFWQMDHLDFQATDIIAFARILERYYGQPVQIEFSVKYEWSKRGLSFDFLQARPLPAKMFNAPPVEFPKDMQPIYECSAEGICDQELDLLNVYDNNNDKKGLVVYATSWMGSTQTSTLDRAMPKEGAAMIVYATEPGRGHIETLALERGVTLLFHDRNILIKDYAKGAANPLIAKTREVIHNCLGERALGLSNDFAGHKKVRIVADGKIARIYPVKEV